LETRSKRYEMKITKKIGRETPVTSPGIRCSAKDTQANILLSDRQCHKKVAQNIIKIIIFFSIMTQLLQSRKSKVMPCRIKWKLNDSNIGYSPPKYTDQSVFWNMTMTRAFRCNCNMFSSALYGTGLLKRRVRAWARWPNAATSFKSTPEPDGRVLGSCIYKYRPGWKRVILNKQRSTEKKNFSSWSKIFPSMKLRLCNLIKTEQPPL